MPQCLLFATAGHCDRPEHKPALEGWGHGCPLLPSLLSHAHAVLTVCTDPQAGTRTLLGPSGQR